MKSKSVIKKEQQERAVKMADFLAKFDDLGIVSVDLSTPTGVLNYQEFDSERKEFFAILGKYSTIKELLG